MAHATGSKTFWVVVADEAQAILYSRETRRAPLVRMARLTNEAARRKTGVQVISSGSSWPSASGSGNRWAA